ncbi:MAG: PTS sugar transporter subunit IIA [Erysipelotrichaceae bacterium]|nr:PTS sugar transporter subunit IIA [Erysipelotrichaceae bacterium]
MKEELVSRELIAARLEVSDWKDGIRKAGSLLVDNGDIEEAYIEEMIDSVLKLGPYMVITKGFALAHSAPSEAVKRNSLSLINLSEGVEFGSVNDPVYVIMCLACTDKTSHMEEIQKVAMRLMKKGTIEALKDAQSIDELYEIINSKE